MAIPGVTTTIRDRFYTIARSSATPGPRVVAVAKRSTADGTEGAADLSAFRATNEADVIAAFGEGSDLHKAFLELVLAGAERVFLVPLPSDTVFDYSSGTITSASFGGSADELMDAAFDAAESTRPSSILAWGRGAHPVDYDDPNLSAATPSGDEPGFGFYADNSATAAQSFAYKIGAQAKRISEDTFPCIAVLGVKPYVTNPAENMTPAQVSSHLSLTNLVDRDSSDLFKEVGPYVVVIAAEIKPVNFNSGGFDFGYSNGAAHVAAAITRMQSTTSLVNQPVYNVQSLRYSPTRTQRTNLSDKGVNTVMINFNSAAVYGESLTFAQSTSDYTRLSTKRIIDEAARLVRQQCEKFVGQPSNLQTRNAMETAISSALRGMQLLGAVLSSDFSVTYIANQNKAIVDLVLTPAFELKNIEIQVSISL
jgi:hypothetical protein